MRAAWLKALIAGVKVRCEAVERNWHGRLVGKVFSSNGVGHRSQVGVGGLGIGIPAELGSG
jgi:endonuclease YncB( thermonuclease family)